MSPAIEPAVTPTAERAPAIMRAPELSSVPAPVVAPISQLASAVTSTPEPTPVSAPAEEALMPRPNEIVPLGTPAAAAPAYGDYYRVRLAGYATRERALEFRREIARRTPELQGTVRVVAERVSLAPRARLRYTLVSAPLPSRDAADLACGALEARGLICRTEPATSPLTLRL
jgi:hypothetical protein